MLNLNALLARLEPRTEGHGRWHVRSVWARPESDGGEGYLNLSPRCQEKAAILPSVFSLELPKLDQCFRNPADIILSEAFVVYEDDPSVVDPALAPGAEERWNGLQVKGQ